MLFSPPVFFAMLAPAVAGIPPATGERTKRRRASDYLQTFDDQRVIKLAVRRVRPEIVLPLVVILSALAMTISHGSSPKFIYFDF
jgi:hypothetical protein